METFDFTFQKAPVKAVRLPWKLDLREVEGVPLSRPKSFEYPWLVINADGSCHMLTDDVFRRLYSPSNNGSRAYLDAMEAA